MTEESEIDAVDEIRMAGMLADEILKICEEEKMPARIIQAAFGAVWARTLHATGYSKGDFMEMCHKMSFVFKD